MFLEPRERFVNAVKSSPKFGKTSEKRSTLVTYTQNRGKCTDLTEEHVTNSFDFTSDFIPRSIVFTPSYQRKFGKFNQETLFSIKQNLQASGGIFST